MSPFQERVAAWVVDAFGRQVAFDPQERAMRLLEEALELAQAAGLRKLQALALVEYVYGRPLGLVAQEVGGVMVTLAALCSAFYLDLGRCASDELARAIAHTREIRAKQAGKPHDIKGAEA